MKRLSAQLPDHVIEQIEDLKDYYENMAKELDRPSTTDIIRMSITANWNEKCLPFN